MSDDIVSIEESKVNRVLIHLQKNSQLEDLMYAQEINDLMKNSSSNLTPSSTTNLLLFLILIYQTDPHLQDYSQVTKLNPIDQQRVNSILNKILKYNFD